MEQMPPATIITAGKPAVTEHGSHTGQVPWVWLPMTLQSLIPCLQGWHGRTRQAGQREKWQHCDTHTCACPQRHLGFLSKASAAAFASSSPFPGMVMVTSPRPPLPPSRHSQLSGERPWAATAPSPIPAAVAVVLNNQNLAQVKHWHLAQPWGTRLRAALTPFSVSSVASLRSRDRHTVLLGPLIMNNY